MTLPRETFELFRKIAATCERWDMIPYNSIVVAGVSGGVDSMVMLAFLDYYRSRHDYFLLACHLNHMIRGDEADKDELLVESYCMEHAIPYVSVRKDIPKLAEELGVSIEQAGRDARRETMMRLGKEYAGELTPFRIAFAHHMDDRAESILMHVGRGSGLAGLVGIRYVDGAFIRPLLDVRLEEVESAARAIGLSWREDASNQSDEYLRNRVRRTLIPAWADVLGYDPVPVLVRLGDAAEGDERALAHWADLSYREALLPDGKLALSSLADCPSAVTKRVLVRCFDDSMARYFAAASEGFSADDADDGSDAVSSANLLQGGSSLSLGSKHLTQLLDGMEKSAQGEGGDRSFSLPGGVIAHIVDGCLFFVFSARENET